MWNEILFLNGKSHMIYPPIRGKPPIILTFNFVDKGFSCSIIILRLMLIDFVL